MAESSSVQQVFDMGLMPNLEDLGITLTPELSNEVTLPKEELKVEREKTSDFEAKMLSLNLEVENPRAKL